MRKSVCVLWATVTIAWAWAFVFQTPSANATSGTHVVQSNWDAWFSLTATDGLRLHDATFNGKTVFNSGISIPQVRVLYPDGNVLFDSLGSFYNLSGIVKSNISNGFQVTADFCYGSGCGDYYYVQTYNLRSDGTLDAWLEIDGPGLSGHGGKPTYRATWRIDFDIKGGSGDYFDKWDGSWVNPTLEGGWDDDGFHSPGDNEWRNSDPSEQMLTHPYSVDAAKLYAVLFHTGEGDADSSAPIWGPPSRTPSPSKTPTTSIGTDPTARTVALRVVSRDPDS